MQGLFQTRQIARAMYNSYDFNSLAKRPIEDDKLREVLEGKHSSVGKQAVLDLRGPTEARMGQQKSEGFISHFIEVECGFNARIGCDVHSRMSRVT